MSSAIISTKTKVTSLDFEEAWSHLTAKERNYAYYLSKASWAGVKVTFHQMSYEAPLLLLLFQAYFQSRDFFALKTAALENGVEEVEWEQFLAYVAGFYANFSNYTSNDQKKFAPAMGQFLYFKLILTSNPLYEDPDSTYKALLDEIWTLIFPEIFTTDKPYT